MSTKKAAIKKAAPKKAATKKAATKKAAPKKAAPKKAATKRAAPGKSHPSPLTPILADLEQALGTLYPETHARLRQTPAVDEALYAELGHPCPPMIQELYGWLDGCDGFLVTPDAEEADWLGLAHAMDERRMLLDLAAEGKTTFEDNLLPMFGGDGDFICADLTSDGDEVTLWRFFHEEPKERKPRAKLSYLMKLTLSAVKKGRWGNGFEGEAGRTRREKVLVRHRSALASLDAPDPDYETIIKVVHELSADRMHREAFELAEKAAAAAGEPENQLAYAVTRARTAYLPQLVLDGDLARAKVTAERVLADGTDFPVLKGYFDALHGLGEAKAKLTEVLAAARRYAAHEREGIIHREGRGYRQDPSTLREAAVHELQVARMAATVGDSAGAREAIAHARSVRTQAAWVDQQLSADAVLAALA